MISPASVVPQDLLASQGRSANLGESSRGVSSQNPICAAATSVRTSSSRLSGYARPFRFAKEFGPDQVLRSDTRGEQATGI